MTQRKPCIGKILKLWSSAGGTPLSVRAPHPNLGPARTPWLKTSATPKLIREMLEAQNERQGQASAEIAVERAAVPEYPVGLL